MDSIHVQLQVGQNPSCPNSDANGFLWCGIEFPVPASYLGSKSAVSLQLTESEADMLQKLLDDTESPGKKRLGYFGNLSPIAFRGISRFIGFQTFMGLWRT